MLIIRLLKLIKELGYYVKHVNRSDISDFIEKNHYSGSINGCISDYCFGLYDTNHELIGAMFYGRMAMANQYKRFSDDSNKVIELRRLCCVDNTPKNTESFFIGKTLKMMKKLWGTGIVVSYADKEYNHSGIIYKATNFTLDREISGAKVIIYNGKRYHDKAIRTKYKGELKPFAKKLKEALENGDAYYVKTKGKFCFTYEIK